MAARQANTAPSGNVGGAAPAVAPQNAAPPAQTQPNVTVQAVPAGAVVQKEVVLPSVASDIDIVAARKDGVIDEKHVTDDVKPKSGLRTSLFGEKAPTREELMGIVRPEAAAAADGSTAASIEAKPGEATSEGTKEGDNKPVAAATDGSKASGDVAVSADGASGEAKKPEGQQDGNIPAPKVVPLSALQEAREKTKLLNTEVLNLRRALVESERRAQGKSVAEPVPGFTVLSEEEEKALYDEDAFSFHKYQQKKADHLKGLEAAESQSRNERMIIDSARQALDAAVPGVLENKDGIGEELTAMAAFFGMEPEVLAILSEPSVRVTIPGTKKSFPLGSAAVSLVSMLNSVNSAIKAMAEYVPADGKKVDVKTLEQKLRETITVELMDKMKTSGGSFVSIGDAAGSSQEKAGSAAGGQRTMLSEVEYRKLSPEERKARLGG